jgi:pimeloyl-ACP methyl ester carboxylesterase
VKLGELELYYEIHGDGEPLVCVMGLGADLSVWELQIPDFSRHYRTVAFDNRDAGRSSYVDAPYGIREMAEDTIALADVLDLERFHLLGQSMGGAIAQEVALAIPDRVLTLTLCVTYAAATAWTRERARLEAETMAAKSDEQLLDEQLLASFSNEAYSRPGFISYLRRLILSYPYPQRRAGLRRQLEATSRHDARDRLHLLRMPVHVIGAEEDLRVPVWRSRELADLIPGARLSIIPGAGHAANIERPDELNKLVLEFLRDAAGARSSATG